MEGDINEFNGPTVTLADEANRQLACSIERTLNVEGREYLLLMPLNVPIQIFVWEGDDEEAVLMDVEDEDIPPLFSTARAVLAELDLMLEHSAHTLTASGELPDPSDEDCFSLEVEEEDETTGVEEFQMLASFFHEDRQYTLCTPLEPLLFFAERLASGTSVLVTPEEFQQIQSQLEDQLFDALD